MAVLEHAAARRSAADVHSPHDALLEEEHELTELLLDCIRMAAAARPVSIPESAGRFPMRQLLDVLRHRFLEELRASPASLSNRQTVRILWAMDRVQSAIMDDVSQRFADRLGGPDAMQLLVEVAHDMRSPLNAILFLTEHIRSGRSGPLAPVQERQMGLVYGAAFGLSTLTSDLIELAHGGNRLIDHPIPFSISGVLGSVRDIVQPIAEEKQLQMRLTGPESDVRVGHPVALNRVLLNLTTNALKYTERGSVVVTCEPSSRTRVEFAIQDTGRGMPQSVIDTLFDTFRRRRSCDDYAFSSAGLGLAICQKLITAMGGELRVETEIEKGTRFSFELDLPASPRLSDGSL